MLETILDELFLSTEVYGYLGPLIIVIAGSYLVKRDKPLFIIFFIVDALLAYHYWNLVSVDGVYIWHALIMTLGVLSTIVYPMWDR